MKAVLCLIAGFAAEVCAARFGILPPLELEHSGLAQVAIEAVLVVCLFCTGLMITVPLDLPAWRAPLRLAAVTMPVTAVLIAGAARVLLGLPFDEALVLGAILAPTDPVLAAVLELPAAERQSRARFALMAEGALTSGLALPLVVLAAGLQGGADLGPIGARWLLFDVIWAVGGGAILGALLGTLTARALLRLDPRSELGWLAVLLGASALATTYGAALLVQVNGLIAVFAAGLAFARGGIVWRRAHPSSFTRRLAADAERVERLAELAAVVLLGALLASSAARPGLILFALVVLVAVRPLAARLGIGAAPRGVQAADLDSERQTIAWFGVRGVASLYLLSQALDAVAGGSTDSGELAAITLVVLATSIALHGLTAMPLGKRPAGAQGSR